MVVRANRRSPTVPFHYDERPVTCASCRETCDLADAVAQELHDEQVTVLRGLRDMKFSEVYTVREKLVNRVRELVKKGKELCELIRERRNRGCGCRR